jgi:hypothetical protein
VRFGLLRADVNHNADLGCFAARQEIGVLSEVDCVGASAGAVSTALGKSTDLIGAAIDPGLGIGAVEKLAIEKVGTSLWVEDRFGDWRCEGIGSKVGHLLGMTVL